MKNRNIDIYLRTAFKELEAFSIPDIGTFRKIYRSAAVSEERDQVHPPVIEIEYEEVVRESVPLAGYLQNIVQLPAGESIQIVAAIRQTILAALNEHQRFEITDIGTLKRLEDGHLAFYPADQAKSLFATDFFGLKPVQLVGTPATVLSAETPDKPVPMTNSENNKKKSLAGSIGWKPVLVVALFIALGVILIQNGPFITGQDPANPLTNQDNVDTSKNLTEASSSPAPPATGSVDSMSDASSTSTDVISDSSVPGTVRVESSPAEKTAPDTELLAEGNTASEPVTEEKEGVRALAPASESVGAERSEGTTRGAAAETKAIDISVLDTTKRHVRKPAVTSVNTTSGATVTARKKAPQKVDSYHLITGSFSSSRAAATFVKELEEEGRKATILFPPAGSSQSYRVSVYSSKDRQQVQDYSNMLKSLGRKAGWIYAKPAQ